MGWQLRDDVVTDEKGNTVCKFFPNTNPSIISLIKNGDYALNLMEEFINSYDSKRKILKSLFNEFKELIDEKKNYNLEWNFNNSGDLQDDQNNIICTFNKKGNHYSKIIKFLPLVFSAIQECVENFNSSSNAKQKLTYEKFCSVYNKIRQE